MDTLRTFSASLLTRVSSLFESVVSYVLTVLSPSNHYFWLVLAALALILALRFGSWKDRESELRKNGSHELVVFVSFFSYVIVSALYAVIFPLSLFYIFAKSKKGSHKTE